MSSSSSEASTMAAKTPRAANNNNNHRHDAIGGEAHNGKPWPETTSRKKTTPSLQRRSSSRRRSKPTRSKSQKATSTTTATSNISTPLKIHVDNLNTDKTPTTNDDDDDADCQHHHDQGATSPTSPTLTATGLLETIASANTAIANDATDKEEHENNDNFDDSVMASPNQLDKTTELPKNSFSSSSLSKRKSLSSSSLSPIRPARRSTMNEDSASKPLSNQGTLDKQQSSIRKSRTSLSTQQNDKSWTYHEQELNRLLNSSNNHTHDHSLLQAGADCLDASLLMLQSSMQQAKLAVIATQPPMDCQVPSTTTTTTTRHAGEDDDDYDEEDDDYDDEDTRHSKYETAAKKEQLLTSALNHSDPTPTTNTTSSWWMTIVQRLKDSHDAERSQWKTDLSVAKLQGQHLKSELRESIEQRIQWLEERLAWEDRLQQQNGRAPETVPSVSSGTTMVTASTFGNYTQYTGATTHHGDASLYRSVAGAATNGVEVSFDTAQAIQRLGELEQRVQDFEFEKEQWERALAHAEVELQNDKTLSSAMQEQLQRLAQEVESYSDTNHKHCKEKQKVQKQLLQLLDQQLTTERYEWAQEKEMLDHTIQQLTLDMAQASVEQRNTTEKLQRLAREERKLKAQRETWLYDKNLMQINIEQLLDDKMAYKASADQLRRELAEAKQRLGEPMDDSDPPAVESVYSELDENLDRAVAERDLYKQEAEHLRQTLEMERARWLEAEATADETVSEIRNEFGAMVEELRAQLKQANSSSSDTDVKKPASKTEVSSADHVNVDEERLKQIRDEYTAVIEDLEERLDSQHDTNSKQLQECLDKNKELISKLRAGERQHADERGEWKLRLEAALADGRKLRETKEALEVELRELQSAHSATVNDAPMNDQLQAALAETERLQLELAKLRQNYEEEVQAIFDQAKSRQSPTSKGEWKLQLEAALAETRRVRRLKEDLESEIRELRQTFDKEKEELLQSGNVDVIELRRELETIQLSADKLRKENDSLKAEIATLHGEESELRHLKDLYDDLKEKHDRESQEWSAQLDESRLHEEVEVEELKKNFIKEAKDFQKAIRREQKAAQELKENHANEVNGLKAKIKEAAHMSEELRKLKSQQSIAKTKWESELLRITTEKDGRIRELELTLSHMKEQRESSERLLSTVTKMIDGLRGDILAVKESLDAAGDNPAFADLKASMDQVQSGINDTIAEVTLEADAIMEIKAMVEAIPKQSGESTVWPMQQEALMSELQQIRLQLEGLLQAGSTGPKDVMYQEAITELQRKVLQVAELQAEYERIKMELERKSGQLVHAEEEISALNDQADAYSDEIMRIQAINADLEKNLKLAERKIQALLNAPDMSRGLDEFDDYAKGNSYDDTTPMLEEALALAQGLQELVQGRDSDQNVLEMLQSLSDLMDHHERAEDSLSQTSSRDESAIMHQPIRNIDVSKEAPHTPQSRQQSDHRDTPVQRQEREEPPPDPVNTPLHSNRHAGHNVPLQMLVEQLYSRCQMLERERSEMMEVTLTLLESARKSNAAEMDAALATVRRRTMEDIIRVRQQTIKDQEQLLQRVSLENGTKSTGVYLAPEQAKPLERSRPIALAE